MVRSLRVPRCCIEGEGSGPILTAGLQRVMGTAVAAGSRVGAHCAGESSSRRNTMAQELKPLDQQVIVITGASSGIGLATARGRRRAGRQARARRAQRRDARRDRAADQRRRRRGRSRVVADVGERAAGRAHRRGRDRRGSAASTPGSTTPASRSTAGSTRSARRTAAGCSTPTSGASSTARSPRCRT